MKSSRASEIDLLRFLAAVAVMLFHYAFWGHAGQAHVLMGYPLLAPVAKYGYLGVALFFMISGFVILMTASAGDLRHFVISRIARLYPAFWVCCTITFLAILAMGGLRHTATFTQYLVNMTMLSEFFSVPEIDGSYWSLFVEIRFYVLISLVLLLGQIRRAELLLVLWLCVTALVDSLEQGGLHVPYILKSWLITTYSPYFIAGAMFYLVWSSGASLTRLGVILGCWLLAIVQDWFSLPSLEGRFHTHMSHLVIVAIVSSFFVTLFFISFRKTSWIGKTNWLFMGALTYPLYLIHQVVGYMIFDMAYPVVNPHALMWGTILLMMFCAYLVNAVVEKRGARLLKSWLNTQFCRIEHCIQSAARFGKSVREPSSIAGAPKQPE